MFEGFISVSESSKSDFSSAFKLGAVVLPATDSLLAQLGYDVLALGPLAMGVVIEEGSKRSHVHFPEIKVSLWMDHVEIKDVQDEIAVDPAFKSVQKYFDESPEKMLLPCLMSYLVNTLGATHVLGVDHGELEDVWEEAPAKLKEYFQGNIKGIVCRLSLGLEEMNPKKLEELKEKLPQRLLLTRFLPSGMYKFELSLYLKR